MSEIFPGIHWLKMPISLEQSSLTHVNIYLVEGDKGYLLVDAGWNTDQSFATLHNFLIKNGKNFQDIWQIVVTHVHPDHYGMAGRIKELAGATMAMPHIEKDLSEPRYVAMQELLQKTDHMLVANGTPEKVMVVLRDASLDVEKYIVPTMPDKLLHDGDTITTGAFTFRVIWTPGHSSGHICLYEPGKKVLLCGDHILPKITPNISVNPQSIENPLGRYLESLRNLRQLDVELTLPGHDQPFKNLKPRIDEIIYHHGLRNLEILGTIAFRSKTAYKMDKEITWSENSGWDDLPPFPQPRAGVATLRP